MPSWNRLDLVGPLLDLPNLILRKAFLVSDSKFPRQCFGNLFHPNSSSWCRYLVANPHEPSAHPTSVHNAVEVKRLKTRFSMPKMSELYWGPISCQWTLISCFTNLSSFGGGMFLSQFFQPFVLLVSTFDRTTISVSSINFSYSGFEHSDWMKSFDSPLERFKWAERKFTLNVLYKILPWAGYDISCHWNSCKDFTTFLPLIIKLMDIVKCCHFGH